MVRLYLLRLQETAYTSIRSSIAYIIHQILCNLIEQIHIRQFIALNDITLNDGMIYLLHISHFFRLC